MLRNAKRRWILAAVALTSLTAAGLGLVRWRALKALGRAEQQVAAEQSLHFSVRVLPPRADSRFEWISAPAAFSQAIEFQGHLFLCGSAGFYEYSGDGKLEQTYRVGTQLPSSPLIAMATGVLGDSGEPELLIATKGEGLLAFDGSRFRQIRPDDADDRAITAILALDSGQLLIGTSKDGVLVYDGKRLAPFHPTLSRIHVTALAVARIENKPSGQSDLWVGTIDRGVLHFHGGETDSFSEAQGLPDPQILSLLSVGAQTFVGTPLGVAEFRNGRFERVVARGAFAQALGMDGGALVVGTLDQGIARIPLTASPLHAGPLHSFEQMDNIVQILPSGGHLYALAPQALYELGRGSAESSVVIQPADAALTDGNVSALSIDGKGYLWVGYFNRGLDVLDAGWRLLRHVEDESVFCVNRIVPARAGAATAVATANGLVLFDADANERQVLTTRDGLIADDVTDVSVDADGMTLATPAGITFFGPDGARSLYAFQGLVNNHVYALAASGHQLMAGTLGGITMLDRGQIVTSYTTANSGLKHNWISAVVPIGNGWMVGTYGGGIVRLDDTGHFHSYDIATANFEVNPNAMLLTDRHIFAGSLDRGLYIYDRAGDRWSNLNVGLPSNNVTALSESNGYIYVGTDNGLVRAREEDIKP